MLDRKTELIKETLDALQLLDEHKDKQYELRESNEIAAEPRPVPETKTKKKKKKRKTKVATTASDEEDFLRRDKENYIRSFQRQAVQKAIEAEERRRHWEEVARRKGLLDSSDDREKTAIATPSDVLPPMEAAVPEPEEPGKPGPSTPPPENEPSPAKPKEVPSAAWATYSPVTPAHMKKEVVSKPVEDTEELDDGAPNWTDVIDPVPVEPLVPQPRSNSTTRDVAPPSNDISPMLHDVAPPSNEIGRVVPQQFVESQAKRGSSRRISNLESNIANSSMVAPIGQPATGVAVAPTGAIPSSRQTLPPADPQAATPPIQPISQPVSNNPAQPTDFDHGMDRYPPLQPPDAIEEGPPRSVSFITSFANASQALPPPPPERELIYEREPPMRTSSLPSGPVEVAGSTRRPSQTEEWFVIGDQTVPLSTLRRKMTHMPLQDVHRYALGMVQLAATIAAKSDRTELDESRLILLRKETLRFLFHASLGKEPYLESVSFLARKLEEIGDRKRAFEVYLHGARWTGDPLCVHQAARIATSGIPHVIPPDPARAAEIKTWLRTGDPNREKPLPNSVSRPKSGDTAGHAIKHFFGLKK